MVGSHPMDCFLCFVVVEFFVRDAISSLNCLLRLRSRQHEGLRIVGSAVMSSSLRLLLGARILVDLMVIH